MHPIQPLVRPDIALADFVAALGYTLHPGTAQSARDRLGDLWGGRAHTLATTTLRAGLDLYLQALALPAGSEILMSAITHPDMVEIVRVHGLVPVPVDVDPTTLGPDLEALHRAVSPRSRALVVAQLLGGRIALDPVLALCRQKGLFLMEDCAQTFGGTYRGHPDADIALFSFGPLKTRTALGGALAKVRDVAVRDRMATIQEGFPAMSEREFAGRLMKYGSIRVLSDGPRSWGLFFWAISRTGRPPNEVIRRLIRNVDGSFRIERFRVKPAVSLLRLLARRIEEGDRTSSIPRRRELGEELTRLLDGLELPGTGVLDPLHWLFPVMVADPAATLDRLLEAGYQTMPGLSNLGTFDPPADRPETAPHQARRILDSCLIVPLHSGLIQSDLEKMAEILRRSALPSAGTRKEESCRDAAA